MLPKLFKKPIILSLSLLVPLCSSAARSSELKGLNDPFAVGMRLVEERSYPDAVELFRAAVEEDPKFVAAHVELARSLVLSGKRLEGMNQLAKAAKISVRSVDKDRVAEQRTLLAGIFYTNQTFQQFQDGLNLQRDRKTRAAVQSFEKALAKEPTNVKILVAYGNALLTLDDRAQSVPLLEKAHSILPEREDIRFSLAKGILEQNPKRAANLLEAQVDKAEAEEESVLVYVQALDRLGEVRKAIAVLLKSTEQRHDRLQSLFWLGKLYSLQPEGVWMARRYLMVFLRRMESKAQGKGTKDPVLDRLEREAKSLLERINTDLGVASA